MCLTQDSERFYPELDVAVLLFWIDVFFRAFIDDAGGRNGIQLLHVLRGVNRRTRTRNDSLDHAAHIAKIQKNELALIARDVNEARNRNGFPDMIRQISDECTIFHAYNATPTF